jgi:hypothetical protein
MCCKTEVDSKVQQPICSASVIYLYLQTYLDLHMTSIVRTVTEFFLQREIFPNSVNSIWLAPLSVWNVIGTPLVYLPLIEGECVEQLCNVFSLTVQTPCSRVFPEKLTDPQLVKKFHVFYGTRRLIVAFTRARHLSLSWVRSIHSMPPIPLL